MFWVWILIVFLIIIVAIILLAIFWKPKAMLVPKVIAVDSGRRVGRARKATDTNVYPFSEFPASVHPRVQVQHIQERNEPKLVLEPMIDHYLSAFYPLMSNDGVTGMKNGNYENIPSGRGTGVRCLYMQNIVPE